MENVMQTLGSSGGSNPNKKVKYKYLSQHLAGCLFAVKSGAGGLECDIGGVGDLISTKRGRLGTGMVEAGMFLKLTKDEKILDTNEVETLSNSSWKSKIPKRVDYPETYFVTEEEGVDISSEEEAD